MTTKQKLKSILFLICFILSAILYSNSIEENDNRSATNTTDTVNTNYTIYLNK